MEATNVDDNQCYNGGILLRARGIPDGVVKIEGLGRGGYREGISAIHSRGTRLFYEVNNMNKDSLHFLLSNNAFFFFWHC